MNGGFTLVEVLVAVLVLSFGLLGVVGLQAASLQANRDARLQSVAILYARELAEMMRGNKDAALLAGATNPYLNDYSGTQTLNTNTCLNIGQTCASSTDLGNAQMVDWLVRVFADLPGAKVVICRDSKPYEAANGLPQYPCTKASSDPIVVKIGWARASKNSASGVIEQADSPSSRPLVVLSVTAGSAN